MFDTDSPTDICGVGVQGGTLIGMTKYKLYKHDARIYKDWWVFPLAVQVHLNDMIYRDKNFAITLHFLCFHVRWLFMEVEV